MFKRILLSIAFMIMFAAKVFACEVTFEAIAEKYDLRDELFDDYLGVYWPGYEIDPASVRFNGRIYDLVSSIDGDSFENDIYFVRLLHDGSQLFIQKSLYMGQDVDTFKLIRYLSRPKVFQRYKILVPKIVEVDARDSSRVSSYLARFIPGGTLKDLFQYRIRNLISNEQFLDALNKLNILFENLASIWQSERFLVWADRVNVSTNLDIPIHADLMEEFQRFSKGEAGEINSRELENIRYFRGQWYVIDP